MNFITFFDIFRHLLKFHFSFLLALFNFNSFEHLEYIHRDSFSVLKLPVYPDLLESDFSLTHRGGHSQLTLINLTLLFMQCFIFDGPHCELRQTFSFVIDYSEEFLFDQVNRPVLVGQSPRCDALHLLEDTREVMEEVKNLFLRDDQKLRLLLCF